MLGESLTLSRLANKFSAMPGIGKKSAWRLAFHILTLSQQEVESLAKNLVDVKKNVRRCKICQNLTDYDICKICKDIKRNATLICVVESPKDVIVFEETHKFKGLYHVLHGLISPLDGIGPENLTIKQLIFRVKNSDLVRELIMATNPTVEGDATASYISKLLKPMGIKISRLAYGIPFGSQVQYVDNMTISKALENREII